MKTKIITLLLLAVAFVAGCSDDEPSVGLSQTDFTTSYEGTTLEVEIETEQEWTATSFSRWCKVSQDKGTGNATLKITVQANIAEARSNTVAIWTPQGIRYIGIQQEAYPSGNEYHYQIPVIFHVLYADASDNNQYVDAQRLAELIDQVNEYYKGYTPFSGTVEGVDMNLEFVLADKDEAGNVLPNVGVEYIQVEEMPLDCETFMEKGEEYVELLWDPNEYINVMVYNFASVQGGNTIILGVSHLPLSIKGETALEGLATTTYTYLTKENLNYPRCVSINSLYVYEERNASNPYNSAAADVTLAHELGHYLGLLHAFYDDGKGCEDSDYCADTPPYNRDAYLANVEAIFYEAYQNGTSVSFADVVTRENCQTGETFVSYNLMDYFYSYSDRFTNDQRKRIRHVLTYSPMIPGPKKGKAATRAVIEGKLDLPNDFIK